MPTLEEIQQRVEEIRQQTAGLTTQTQALQAGNVGTDLTNQQADAATLKALMQNTDVATTTAPAVLGSPPEERLSTAQELIDATTATGNGIFAEATTQDEFFKAQQELLKQQTEQLDKLEKEQQKFVNRFLDRPTVDISAERARLEQEAKIPEFMETTRPIISQIGALNEQLATIESGRQIALQEVQDRRGVSMNFMSGEQKRIDREYDRRALGIAAQLNAKTATVSMYRGLIDDARTNVDNMIQALMYDNQVARQDITDYMSFYESEIDELEESQKNILNDVRADIEKREAEQKADLTFKKELMLDAAAKGVILDWGPDDFQRPQEDLIREYSQKVATAGAVAATQVGVEEREPVIPGTTPGADIKMISVPTDAGFASIPIDVNNVNSGTIDQLRKAGLSDTDIRSWLDSNTKLTKSTIDSLLEKESTLEEIKESTKKVFQQYKVAGYTRKQIEEQWKSDNNATELTPLIEGILDEIFPEEKKWWEFWK